MTTPDEEKKALIWAGEFLLKLVHTYKRVPKDVLREAEMVLRHYPGRVRVDTYWRTGRTD